MGHISDRRLAANSLIPFFHNTLGRCGLPSEILCVCVCGTEPHWLEGSPSHSRYPSYSAVCVPPTQKLEGLSAHHRCGGSLVFLQNGRIVHHYRIAAVKDCSGDVETTMALISDGNAEILTGDEDVQIFTNLALNAATIA